MGQYARGRITASGRHTDNFHLCLSLEDVVYLNHRMYLPQQHNPPLVVCMLSRLDKIKLQRSNLIELLRMVVLRADCRHKKIYDFIGNLIKPPAINLTTCGDACPFCCDMITNYVMPTSRAGLSQFLADVFINNPGGEVSPVFSKKTNRV